MHSLGILTFGVIITLLFSMYTDCAEYGEWKTGKHTAGLTVSASMFSLKFGSAVGGRLPGFVLAWFGFVANACADRLGDRRNTADVQRPCRRSSSSLGGLLMFLLPRSTGMTRVETELHERRAAPGG